jgi:hypothetical protein
MYSALSTQEQRKQPTARKENLTTLKKLKPSIPKPSEAPTLHHMRARIIVFDGGYQIQYLPPIFSLWTHCLNSPMKVLFNGYLLI